MDDLDLIALLPREKGISLEEMLERAFFAKTGRHMTDKEYEKLSPKLDEVKHLRQITITYRKKWLG